MKFTFEMDEAVGEIHELVSAVLAGAHAKLAGEAIACKKISGVALAAQPNRF